MHEKGKPPLICLQVSYLLITSLNLLDFQIEIFGYYDWTRGLFCTMSAENVGNVVGQKSCSGGS